MKRFVSLLPLLFIYAFFACQGTKEKQIKYEQAEQAPPLVITTSLDDTLPEKAVHSLNLQERVLGTKVKYMTGIQASYFEYEADADQVLTMISRLPFSVYALQADTTCLRMDRRHLDLIKQRISAVEYESAPAFWGAGDEFEIHACNKYPYLHTVLIDLKSNKVLHRVLFQEG